MKYQFSSLILPNETVVSRELKRKSMEPQKHKTIRLVLLGLRFVLTEDHLNS